jgi:hypothetical protein
MLGELQRAMKTYMDDGHQYLKKLQPIIVKEDVIDNDIRKTEESLKEMNQRFERIKQQ